MLDKKSRLLLEYINKECGEGAYKIFEFSDIKRDLRNARFDAEGIAETINYLAEYDYIKLKYIDDENLCVTNTPRGRVYHEETRSLSLEVNYRKRTVITVLLFSFLGAVVGSFIGVIVATLIMRMF